MMQYSHPHSTLLSPSRETCRCDHPFRLLFVIFLIHAVHDAQQLGGHLHPCRHEAAFDDVPDRADTSIGFFMAFISSLWLIGVV
jgi:hypothetical protein